MADEIQEAQYPNGKEQKCKDCCQMLCENRPLPAEGLHELAGLHGVASQELRDAVDEATCEQQGGYIKRLPGVGGG